MVERSSDRAIESASDQVEGTSGRAMGSAEVEVAEVEVYDADMWLVVERRRWMLGRGIAILKAAEHLYCSGCRDGVGGR